MDIGKICVLNTEANNDVACYRQWSNGRGSEMSGAEKMLLPLVGYCGGICVEELRNIA
jgi:hypothetical protein